ncbi:hypothetical protein ABK040_015379 [Willaertia magna]
MQEEPEIKKRKLTKEEDEIDNVNDLSIDDAIIQQPLFPADIISEIMKYINEIVDYFNLALINKAMFNLMMKENIHSLNKLFKRKQVILNNEIPNYFFNNLHYLNIYYSNYCSLQKCTKLKALGISCSDINDTILENMLDLKGLHLHYCNNITGTCFKNLKQLLTLHLDCVNIADNYLTDLQNLQNLCLTQCTTLTGTFLQNLNQLTFLNLLNTNIDNTYLSSLTNLKILKVKGNSHLNIDLLNNLTKLEVLNIEINNITDNDINHLINLKKLKLVGNSTNFTGDSLNNFKKLESLCLKGTFNNLKEENISCLVNLVELYVFQPTHVISTLSFSVKCLRNLTKLEKLTLQLNSEVEDNYLLQLKNIKQLIVPNSENFTGKCLIDSFNLTELNVSHTKMEEKYLFNFKNLTKLNLSNCRNFTGECLLHLNNLTKLNINNTKISEEYLFNLTKLEKLKMYNCPNIVFGNFLIHLNRLQCLQCYDTIVENEDLIDLKEQLQQGSILILAVFKDYGNDDEYITVEMAKKIVTQVKNKDKREMEQAIEEKDNEIKQLKLLVEELKKK